MNWKTKKGYSDKLNLSQQEYWEIVSSWLGLREKQYNSFIAMSFNNFITGKELKPGFVREMVGTQKSILYLMLDEYRLDEFRFTVSISKNYLDHNTKYLVIKNAITVIPNGSRWNIEVSEKSKFPASLFGGLSKNLDSLFHGHIHFEEIN
ncbi:hypothetical protein [Foetidibacter luteolus]|uniref:hypothetical protein n=1 Tax=Foetidibacter luteolus TaxID=2608880 RepID=UPI00129A6470|nr:hypothetical protein [Foetidibacter luteolus]